MRILDILKEVRPEVNFEESTDYIMDGLLDSVDLVYLLEGLEREYGIRVDLAELDIEDVSNLSAIEKLVIKMGGNP